MSLDELDRSADALAHHLAAADIADRAIAHRESLAAMALRLAADIAARTQPAAAVAHLERALQLQQRGASPPAELATTQKQLGELLVKRGDRARGAAMLQAAQRNAPPGK
jgi:hypothetical protein